eukprot:m.111365 g.111365  ORF g.111365 m.111365 type:complete len:479 (-) comp14058_c0_seq1:100-1536(-)
MEKLFLRQSLLVLLFFTMTASAQDGNQTGFCGDTEVSIQTQFFLVVMGSLVFFMQAGFSLLEAGSVGPTTVVNILFKNFADTILGAICFWAFGYAFAYGDNPSYSFIGDSKYFLQHVSLCEYSQWFYQWTFAATATTIVSGSMAGRTRLSGYLSYSLLLTTFIYPTIVHWTWSSDAWLAEGDDDGGYRDFAGSGIVHVTGGTAALVGAYVVGPRGTTKFETYEKKYEIPGHSMPLVALGTMILFFGFLGFNGGSVLHLDTQEDAAIMSLAVVNTVLAAASGGLITVMLNRMFLAHWSLQMTCNGCIAGMVAICAGANTVYPWAATIIGLMGGVSFYLWSVLIRNLGIDDAIDAVGVHMGAGAWGVIAVPLFSFEKSIFYDNTKGAWHDLGWAFAGLAVIILWTGGLCGIMFSILKRYNLLRVTDDTINTGIDIVEHGEAGYSFAGLKATDKVLDEAMRHSSFVKHTDAHRIIPRVSQL